MMELLSLRPKPMKEGGLGYFLMNGNGAHMILRCSWIIGENPKSRNVDGWT
jgi:hypothetical protein